MNKAKIMRRAWSINKYTGYEFSRCLELSWSNTNVKVSKYYGLFITFILLLLLQSSFINFNLTAKINEIKINNIKLELKENFINSLELHFDYKDLPGVSIRDYASYIYKESNERGLNPYLIIAAAYTESSFDPEMIGGVGERGLYQFRPSTAKWILKDKYTNNAEINIMISTKLWFTYYDYLSKLFNTQKEIFLAYNAGQGRIQQLKRYYNGNIEKVKWHLYKRRGWKPYDEKINYFLKKLDKNGII